MMKVLDRYIVTSILKTAFVAMLVFALILAGVELFSKMDSIITGFIPAAKVVEYLLLSLPDYLMMGASLALLFATTYFLSTLSANNERIAMMNAGLSKGRIARPIIILSIFLTMLGIGYQETLLNDLNTRHDQLSSELFGSSSTQDVRNIVLKDDNGFVIYAKRYSENSRSLSNPVLIKTEDGRLKERVEANSARFNGTWTFLKAKVYTIGDDGVNYTSFDAYETKDFKLEPDYFKGSNINVETMEIPIAFNYLTKLKTVDNEAWKEKCTDYLRKVFKPMAIFVLMTVSATMNYSLRKNILLFSIIQSLSIAVVYYVADMVFSIAAHQGAITPLMCIALPVLVTIGISALINRLGKLL